MDVQDAVAVRADACPGQCGGDGGGLSQAQQGGVLWREALADDIHSHGPASGVGEVSQSDGFVVAEAIAGGLHGRDGLAVRGGAGEQVDEVVLADALRARGGQDEAAAVADGPLVVLYAFVGLVEALGQRAGDFGDKGVGGLGDPADERGLGWGDGGIQCGAG